jgi:hypothetical protein
MICPHCGKETKGGKSCEKCGKELAAPREVEVRYTDFKVSELLDIRMPGKSPVGKETGKPQSGKKIPEESKRRKRQPVKKVSRTALVVILLLLAAAVAYYLLKSLM